MEHSKSKNSKNVQSSDIKSQEPQKKKKRKINWSEHEDKKVKNLVMTSLEEDNGYQWTSIALGMEGRSGKQCRERWHNHLRPELRKGDWSKEEDDLIISMQSQMGNQWTKIGHLLKSRSDNDVKNRWYSLSRSLPRESNKRVLISQMSTDIEKSCKRQKNEPEILISNKTSSSLLKYSLTDIETGPDIEVDNMINKKNAVKMETAVNAFEQTPTKTPLTQFREENFKENDHFAVVSKDCSCYQDENELDNVQQEISSSSSEPWLLPTTFFMDGTPSTPSRKDVDENTASVVDQLYTSPSSFVFDNSVSTTEDPFLSYWFRIMEEGPDLGGDARNKFEIQSPAPVRFFT